MSVSFLIGLILGLVFIGLVIWVSLPRPTGLGKPSSKEDAVTNSYVDDDKQ